MPAVGGHWTCAQVPPGDWARDAFGLDRTPYDRFGHLMQGFVPAVLVREVPGRTSPLRGSRWPGPLTVCACLAFSALFELGEWAAAVIGGHAADDFPATQGDVGDTRWDIFCALIGAVASVLVLGRLHDRQRGRLLGGGHPAAGRAQGPDGRRRVSGTTGQAATSGPPPAP